MLKVVTVEDSLIVAKRLQTLLEETGKIKFLGNATRISKALELVHKCSPDVVILDIHLEEDMPTANGINLLIMLKEKYKHLQIIMLTNLVEEQYRNTCRAYGATYFFDKSKDMNRVPEVLLEMGETSVGK